MEFIEITDSSKLANFIEDANREKICAIDIETTGLNPRTDSITEIVLSHPGMDGAVMIPSELAPDLAHLTCNLIFHNFKFDCAFFSAIGLDFVSNNKVHDTVILHHLYDETKEHKLDSIVQEEYGDNYKQVFWNKYKNYTDADHRDRMEYACKDVWYTLKIYKLLCERLQNQGIENNLIEHVHKLAYSLYKSELMGIKVDIGYLEQKDVDYKVLLSELEEKMYESAKEQCRSIEVELYTKELTKRKTVDGKLRVPLPRFNWASPEQLKTLLYEKLKLPKKFSYNPKKKERSLTTNETALSELKGYHPAVDSILEFRAAQKVHGTYIKGNLERCEGDRIYPSFNVNGTRTGRISHANPNMGNLPSNGGIRGQFLPEPGHVFISRDYSQLEVVIAAHYSQDKNLLKIILEGASKHDITNDEVGLNDRKKAKTLNFAMQYGCGPNKVSQILDVSKEAGQDIWNRYWEVYAGERAVIDQCIFRVDQGLPIVNLFGRHTHYPTEFEKDALKLRAYREAYSALIQGSGADITNRSFYEIDEILINNDWGKALFTIHDECFIMVKEEVAEEADLALKEIMESQTQKSGLTLQLQTDTTGPMERWLDK